jgi:dTDP-4-dehydrorhamnose reductase
MRVVLTGASGQLGAYLRSALADAGYDVRAWGGRTAGAPFRPVDLADPEATARALAEDDPGVIVHAAAVSAADAVCRDPGLAWGVNVGATERLARWCAARGRRLVFTSTDLVFDGSRPWWTESDPAAPVLEYGRTKRAAESAVLAAPRGLAARISLLFGPSRCGRPGFFDRAIAALRAGETRAFFDDEFRTPLHYACAAAILTRLVGAEAAGLIHVGGTERVSRYELMRRAAAALGLDPGLVRANRRAAVALAEPRPADVSLATARLAALLPDIARPPIEPALARRAPTSP